MGKKATKRQRELVRKLCPDMDKERIQKLTGRAAHEIIELQKPPKPKKKDKVWGETISLPAKDGVVRKLCIDPEGERADERQMARLEDLRPDIPAEVLPQLSKEQSTKLIKAAGVRTSG